MKRTIYSLILITGLLLIIGTATASDNNQLTDTQINIYLIVGMSEIAISCFGLYLENEREQKKLIK